MPPPPVSAATCADVARDAFALLDGALSADARAAVARHLDACAPCRAGVARDRRFLAAVRRTRHETPAPTRLRLHAQARFRGWWADAPVAHAE